MTRVRLVSDPVKLTGEEDLTSLASGTYWSPSQAVAEALSLPGPGTGTLEVVAIGPQRMLRWYSTRTPFKIRIARWTGTAWSDWTEIG